MGSLNVWNLNLGQNTGRIKPTGWIAPDGSWVLCLGSDRPGFKAFFNTGDSYGIGQALAIQPTPFLLRMRARIRGPASMPAGLSWTISSAVFGAGDVTHVAVTYPMTPGETRDLSDIAINIGAWGLAFPTFLGFGFALQLLGNAHFTEVELPAFYVDALVVDTTGAVVAANRTPEPGDTGVGTNTQISFDILTPSTWNGVDTWATSIYVNNVLVYAQGVFHAGWLATSGSTSVAFTILGNPTFDLTVPAHPFFGGEAVMLATTGTLPSPLQPNKLYWLYIDDVDDVILLNAPLSQGGTQISVLTAGTGTHAILYNTPTFGARWVLVPPAPFTSNELVTVRVTTPEYIKKSIVFAHVGGNTLNATAHPFLGVGPESVTLTTTGTLPAPLQTNTLYWIEVQDADTLTFLTSPFNGEITETNNGTGVHTIVYNKLSGALVDLSWSFTVQDLSAPVVSSVLGLTTTTVRVFFDEPVVMADAGASDDALNPANYSFQAEEVPAAEATAISVTPYSASAVEVSVDLDFSPGRLYRLAVVGVEDLAGNPVTSPNNTALFYAFRPPAPVGRSFVLWKMIPLVNRQRDVTGDLKRFVDCLQDVTDLMLYDIDRFTEIFDPDKAPEWALDLTLDGLGNPFPFTLSATDKRRLIRVLVTIYRLKGTAVGIIEVVRFFLGLTITITTYQSEGMVLGVSVLGFDWTLGASADWDLYAFEIESPVALTLEQATNIATIANYMKPAHTHLAAIITPAAPITYDPVELGLSRLGLDWTLH